MNASPFVTTIDLSLKEKLTKDLKDQGFELLQPPYTIFQGKKKGVSCTLYTSGKLVVQGKESKTFIEFYLEPEILKTFTYGYGEVFIDQDPRIGVDESGKGDFFGPLCIAGVYAGAEEMKELIKIGVKDSKTMQDGAIAKMAALIRAKVPFHVIQINPPKYNELYSKFANLNYLLAWAHATVIETLSIKTGCKKALIDQFSHLPIVENALKKKGLEIDFTKKTKGESDPVVAAASILARDSFVLGLKKLGEVVGFELPKGASSQVVSCGIRIAKERGPDFLKEVGKAHFKTMDDVLKNFKEGV